MRLDYSYEILNECILEIISHCRYIRKKCDLLLSFNYASESPRNFTRVFINIAKYLEDIIIQINCDLFDRKKKNKLSDQVIDEFISVLIIIDDLVRRISSDIRFIDAARTERIPWSIVKPIEDITYDLIQNVTIMLRSKWKYNYSVITNDIHKYYSYRITEINENINIGIKIQKPDNVFGDFNKPFHIISFPSLEQKNILLHCLIGHEIGHLLIHKEFIDRLHRPKILTEVLKPKIIKELKREGINLRQYELTNKVNEAYEILIRGLDELLSDAIGTLIFGPAFLFSMYELAIQQDLDLQPKYDNNFYPPWRYRIRNIYQLLFSKKYKILPFKNIKFKNTRQLIGRIKLINACVNKNTDLKIINQDIILNIVYKLIKEANHNLLPFIEKSIRKHIINPSKLYDHLPLLINRIDNGIPPNVIEYSNKRKLVASLVEIINAAWVYKICWNDRYIINNKYNEKVFDKRNILNRLILKSIEYSYIEKKYNNISNESLDK